MTSPTKILTSHGKLWEEADENKLREMVNGGADWYTIGETLGRTVGACKARYSMIENKASPPQSGRSSPVVLSKSHKQPPWSSDDELLLLELSALGRSYSDIADLLSVQRSPHTIASYHLALTHRRHDLLQKHDEKKAQVNHKAVKVIPTDYDHLEDIIQQMTKLGLQQSSDKKPSVCCLHCLRPSTTSSSSRQPLCLQCKTVQKAYTVDGLFECLDVIKKTPLAKKDRVPVGKDGLTYIWKSEYHKYLALDLSTRTENEAKTTRPRASCETLLKLALDNGLTDAYTNVDGHWSAKDDLWRLTFAYIVSETGQIKLQPVLAVIARLTECSTEEQIKDWVAAIRSK